MPEKILKKLNAKILPSWKVCFFAALTVGFLAHLYKITNWLPNWDSLVFRYDSQNMVSLGRWFLPVVTALSSFYDLPFLNGLVSIVFHGLSAVCICMILGVQKKITAFLIGAVIVSFPTVTSVMMYNYVADGYAIAFFLSVLAAYFMTCERPKYFACAILIALSAGIYQAYITVTIMLVLIFLINLAVYENASFKAVFKRALSMLLTGILGVALYVVVLKICLYFSSSQLLDYQGMGSTATFSNIDLLSSLYVIKETFKGCFFDLSEGFNVFVALNIFVFAFTLCYYIKTIIKNKLYKKPVCLLLVVVLGVMLIFGAGALAFINPMVDYHNLMLMGYSVFYLFFVLIYERGSEKSEIISAIKCWIVLTTSVLIVLNQIVIANVSYHKAQLAYEKSYGVLMRIAERIEQIPESENCDRLLVVGSLDNSHAYSVNLTPDITGITDGYILRADDETVGQSVLCSALNDYCDKDYKFLQGQEKMILLQNENVKSMREWPHDGCVAVVDGTIVVKLGTEGEN